MLISLWYKSKSEQSHVLDKRRLITGLEERRRRRRKRGKGGEGVTAEGKMAGEVFVFGIWDGGEDKVLLVVVGGAGRTEEDVG